MPCSFSLGKGWGVSAQEAGQRPLWWQTLKANTNTKAVDNSLPS